MTTPDEGTPMTTPFLLRFYEPRVACAVCRQHFLDLFTFWLHLEIHAREARRGLR
jgi:hypothetical protein